jgi:hypothetical protein
MMLFCPSYTPHQSSKQPPNAGFVPCNFPMISLPFLLPPSPSMPHLALHISSDRTPHPDPESLLEKRMVALLCNATMLFSPYYFPSPTACPAQRGVYFAGGWGPNRATLPLDNRTFVQYNTQGDLYHLIISTRPTSQPLSLEGRGQGEGESQSFPTELFLARSSNSIPCLHPPRSLSMSPLPIYTHMGRG